MEAANDDAEDILLRKVIHQWVSIDQSSLHLDQLNITVAQGEPIVENIAVCLISRLSVAILANDVLYCVDFVPAVIRIHYNVAPAPIRGLHYTHDLSRSLSGRGLLSTLLFGDSIIFFIFCLISTCIIDLLLSLLLLIASLLLRSDHSRDYVSVGAGDPVSLFPGVLLNVGGHFRILTRDGIGCIVSSVSYGIGHGV